MSSDVQTYLTVAEDLCAEAQANKTKEFEYCNFLMVAWGPGVIPIINETDERLFEAIEIRYQLNWYRSKVNQVQLKSDILQESYLKSSSQALQANLYDIELEKVETSIRANKKQITKLVDYQKFLSEEIVRFEEEIAARKALEIKRLQRPTVVYQIIKILGMYTIRLNVQYEAINSNKWYLETIAAVTIQPYIN
uniref:Uncharacterized protein n=1 Tax=Glossina pallidipes TaxID=7398 RepID=A0A1A9ZFJ3_GLOPL